MDAGTGQIVYEYFQNPTYPGDFPGTDFLNFIFFNNFLSFDPIEMKICRCILILNCCAIKIEKYQKKVTCF